MTLQHLAPNVQSEGKIHVVVQGTTLGAHEVDVVLNGHSLSPLTFSGQTLGTLDTPIPQSWLHAGEKQITLASELGDTDISVVEDVQLTYWHSYVADGDSLKFTSSSQGALEVGGFSNPQLRVIDITGSCRSDRRSACRGARWQSYAATFSVNGPGTRTLLAFTDASVPAPAWVTANHSSSWHAAQKGYDEIIISNASFEGALQPLVTLRQQQGLSVAVVDVQDVYDEFNFGAKDPNALQSFVQRASTAWQKPPRFLLLVGDATFDPRNYLGLGDFDFVPTKFVDTSYLKTASDKWYVAPGERRADPADWQAAGAHPERRANRRLQDRAVRTKRPVARLGQKTFCWSPIQTSASTSRPQCRVCRPICPVTRASLRSSAGRPTMRQQPPKFRRPSTKDKGSSITLGMAQWNSGMAIS